MTNSGSKLITVRYEPNSKPVSVIQVNIYVRPATDMAAKVILVLVLCCLGGTPFASAVSRLREVFNWRQLDFQFPSVQMKQQALASQSYIPTNALPVGIERWENRLFVSVPRWKDGKCPTRV